MTALAIAYGSTFLTRRLRNLALDLWEESYLEDLQQRWKEGRVAQSFNKRQCLSNSIDGYWQTAEALAAKAGISHKSAVKLLQRMAAENEIELKEECWRDERFRHRRRFLYRKGNRAESSLFLAQLLGIKAPPEKMVFTAHVVRHFIEDD